MTTPVVIGIQNIDLTRVVPQTRSETDVSRSAPRKNRYILFDKLILQLINYKIDRFIRC